MIKNDLKVIWRNLLKHQTFPFINILGLAVGITACLLIFIYVHNDLTFDQYNAKADRIARVTTTLHAPESDIVFATSPEPLAGILKREYPEVESIVRLENDPQMVKLNNDVFNEDAFYRADGSVFSIFRVDFLEGPPTGALQNPNSIVITKTFNTRSLDGRFFLLYLYLIQRKARPQKFHSQTGRRERKICPAGI